MTSTPLKPELHRSLVTTFRVACARSLSGHILDCGGGLGEYLPHLPGEVTVCDRSLPALASLGIGRRVAADAEVLPFRTDSFDNTWSCAVGQYVHLDTFVRELVRVTRPGGRILILVPNGRSPWDRAKRLLGLGSWWDQENIVTHYSVDDLAPYGAVSGEIRFLPFERLFRRLPRIGHTLMLEVRVTR